MELGSPPFFIGFNSALSMSYIDGNKSLRYLEKEIKRHPLTQEMRREGLRRERSKGEGARK